MDRPVYKDGSNVSKTGDDVGHRDYVCQDGDLKSEHCRLLTFSKWPTWSGQCPTKLAEAGLYYTGNGDKTRCAFCTGVVLHWNACDVPIVEHRRLHPKCPFIQGKYVGNIPLQSGSEVSRNFTNGHYCKRSKHTCKRDHEPLTPRPCRVSGNVVPQITCRISGNVEKQQFFPVSGNFDFSKEANRIRSFVKWPRDRTQTIEDLARAGFYHVPTEHKPDRVMCAYCKGKLYNWRFGDDPWIEHARCSPKCPYIVLCVGDDVIRDLVN